MLRTIQVEIDATGHIHPLEPLPFDPAGWALLTLPEPAGSSSKMSLPAGKSTAAQALELLASLRFRQPSSGDAGEVQRRIAELRTDWND